MALRLVNTTPGTVGELVLPGTPFVFSLKSDTAHVDPRSLAVRLGYSQLIERVGKTPLTDTDLAQYATVSVQAAERIATTNPVSISSGASGSVVFASGTSATELGVVEVKIPIVDAYSPILARVSFVVSNTWELGTPYWTNLSNTAPVYFGLEYGIKNTGVFVSLRDDGAAGSVVIGGPLQAYGTSRPAQTETASNWRSAPGQPFSIFIFVEPDTQTVSVWKQGPADAGPVQIGGFMPLGTFGTFVNGTSSFSQRRDGPSSQITLFFGAGFGAATGDHVLTVSDWALYKYYPVSASGLAANVGHELLATPDLPFVFKATDKNLPTAAVFGHWGLAGATTATANFWYQPGRKSEPLYTQIKTTSPGPGYLRRYEPRLVGSPDGFSVEAWMAGESLAPINASRGFGIQVCDGLAEYAVHAIQAELVATYGIMRDPTVADNPDLEFYVPRSGGTVIEADYSGLRLVRMTVDRRRSKVDLYVEDPDVPILSVPMGDPGHPFPVPISATDGMIDVGTLTSNVDASTLNLAALSFANCYLAWEKADGLPTASPVAFTEDDLGGGSISMTTFGTLQVQKISYGPSANNHHYLTRSSDVTYLRGFQLDFRAKVTAYSDGSGSQNTPGVWTGTGVTFFLGTTESPSSVGKKIHVGFFDCGPYGKKVAIVPHDGTDDILQQTARGQKYSAGLDWTQMSTLRLLYRPGKSVELWGYTLLKGVPLISIPWNEFECEDDPHNTTPSITFGQFSPTISGSSEWGYVRWGISSGYDYAITQAIQDVDAVQNGRAYAIISAGETP